MTTQTQEINTLFQNLKEAWNKGDGNLYASYFTENANYIAFDGQHLKGRTENADMHNKLFAGILRDSKLTGEIKSIEFLSPDTAIYHAIGGVQLRFHKSPPRKGLSINTNVVVKENGVWKISAFQNTRIKGPGIFQRLFSKS